MTLNPFDVQWGLTILLNKRKFLWNFVAREVNSLSFHHRKGKSLEKYWKLFRSITFFKNIIHFLRNEKFHRWIKNILIFFHLLKPKICNYQKLPFTFKHHKKVKIDGFKYSKLSDMKHLKCCMYLLNPLILGEDLYRLCLKSTQCMLPFTW